MEIAANCLPPFSGCHEIRSSLIFPESITHPYFSGKPKKQFKVESSKLKVNNQSLL